ncbi:hypothetical protein GXW83_13705 [Streptacidiphilus sp. PB12-B1b]|uniref:hypothetical protein n=1 Tax=Streptacidiphilus sp. PB12-B1b TaxID=2705012 RepID=UPI0015FB8805|nr:hypothetical protein [Streptacidiphilus sp. PB12-B1b]QMU76643.1 hypothetical protein GXW83_13705 [Streptacidiphilus sp. PB12-B1b]
MGALIALAVLVCATGCSSASPTAAAALTGATAPPATTGSAPSPVSAVRLTAAQLPDGAAEKWQSIAPPRTQTVTGRTIQVNECATVHGAVTWQQQAYASTFQTPAEQDVFTFASSSAAHAARLSLASQMDGCQTRSRTLQAAAHIAVDAKVTRTAATDAGSAWSRQWTGVEGLSAAGPQTDHLYAVQVGDTLAVIHFDQWASAHPVVYDTRADLSLLSAVTRQLS